MNIDIVLDSHLPQPKLTELGLLAERHGIGTVWNASYLDGRDPFTNMAELAAKSSSISVAPMALNAYEMHPFRIGMALLTLNELAHGRVKTLIGGGGEVVMALGIPFEKRVRHVRECLEIVRGMTSDRPFSYTGELFSIENYDPQWVTAPPPFLYAGANRPQMLRMAAKAADGILMSDLSVTLAKGAIDAVHDRMSEIGRDPAGFRFNNFMAWYVYDDPAEARHEAKRWIGFRALFREYMMREFMSEHEFAVIMQHIPAIYAMAAKDEDSVDGLPDELLDMCVDKLTLAGGVDELDRIIEHLLEYKAIGVTDICIELKKHQEHGIRLLGERVLPAIR
ncbi:MAG: LLM class flavin-dependent oxidoreductase [Gammaproteobacteria bacterium]|nr:LLM class flavin-dependent oxidoreductase [Gammaproteobacteria bacterium]NND35722.1 LLM class flavin-dependent oxidoreductase [Gammaproteobacteria bacterium]